MITEDYVSFEIAKLLKKKGFDILCDNFYDSSGRTPNESVYGKANIETLDYNANPFVKYGFPKFKTFSAPTHQMAMKWLREKEYAINIDCMDKCFTYKYYIKHINNTDKHTDFKHYNTYEEAIEAALKYCLTNLI